MKFLRLVIDSFIDMPLHGHLLSVFEGLAGYAALRLFAHGYEGWGVTVLIFAMLFAYIDGACGWSIRKKSDDN